MEAVWTCAAAHAAALLIGATVCLAAASRLATACREWHKEAASALDHFHASPAIVSLLSKRWCSKPSRLPRVFLEKSKSCLSREILANQTILLLLLHRPTATTTMSSPPPPRTLHSPAQLSNSPLIWTSTAQTGMIDQWLEMVMAYSNQACLGISNKAPRIVSCQLIVHYPDS